MPTQKTFKQRVRAHMTKTGESYTAARHQLLQKSVEPAAAPAAPSVSADRATSRSLAPLSLSSTELLTSDETMRVGSGRGHEEWFIILDAWRATERKHPEIARWLQAEHDVSGWWAQTITVDYERARGMRGRHQQSNGFSISATRTVAANAEQALAAFTNAATRRGWLREAPMRQRPTRAALAARFDWSDPPSRLIVTVISKDAGKTTVAVTHERLPDAESAERFKRTWRDRLGELKRVLDRD